MRPPRGPPARALLLAGLLGGVGLALLTGCATGAAPQAEPTPLALPAGWSQAQAAGAGALAVTEVSLAAWWQRFDDPRLQDLVQRALAANTSVQGARAALQQAQALRDAAAALLMPTLDSAASAQRGTGGALGPRNTLALGLTAGWAWDLFGVRRAALEASQASAAASAAGLGELQVQIAAEVALNYIGLRSAEARHQIALDNLASQQETLQITQWRQQAGLVTALETEQARAALAQTQAQLQAWVTATVQTRHALAVLAGQPPAALSGPGGLLAPGGAAVSVPQARDEQVLAIPAHTLRQRADVRAAEHQVAAALARLDQAQAQRWPSFSISGSLGLGAASVAALGHSGALASTLLASVNWPVFDGGALQAQVHVQQAALAQAQQAYRAAVLGALQQVEDALVALRGNQQRLASLRLAAAAARNSAWLARQRYSSGLIDFQTVLETQRNQLATQDGVALASAELSSDHVRLFQALGGGWVPDAPDETR